MLNIMKCCFLWDWCGLIVDGRVRYLCFAFSFRSAVDLTTRDACGVWGEGLHVCMLRGNGSWDDESDVSIAWWLHSSV